MLQHLQWYGSKHPLKAVAASDMMRETGIGKNAALSFLGRLRVQEAAAGRHMCEAWGLKWPLEGDGTSVRTTHISANNPNFTAELNKAGSDKGKGYYVLHVRYVGICERDNGYFLIAPLAHNLVPPNSAPPPESAKEILQSGILSCVPDEPAEEPKDLKRKAPKREVKKGLKPKKKKETFFTDGAGGWTKALKTLTYKLEHLRVSHKMHQFAKELGKNLSGVKTAGTMAIDRKWLGLKAFIPNTLVTKEKHNVSPKLAEYVYQYVWRHNKELESAKAGEAHFDFMKALAEIL